MEERRSLRGSLIVTLPTMDATVDEELVVWHKLYEVCDVLSSPPGDTAAPDELLERFGEWVDPADEWYAPLKPYKQRRAARRKPKHATCIECGHASTVQGITMHQNATGHTGSEEISAKEYERVKTEQERAAAKAAKPKPKPKKGKPRPRKAAAVTPRSGPRSPFLRCTSAECDFLGKRCALERHQRDTGHKEKRPVLADESRVIAKAERQEDERRPIPAAHLRRCAECEVLGKPARLKTHHAESGHSGEVRVPQDEAHVEEAAHQRREIRQATARKVAGERWRCNECGFESNATGIHNHADATGHAGRTRI
jgi:hypothetical protein